MKIQRCAEQGGANRESVREYFTSMADRDAGGPPGEYSLMLAVIDYIELECNEQIYGQTSHHRLTLALSDDMAGCRVFLMAHSTRGTHYTNAPESSYTISCHACMQYPWQSLRSEVLTPGEAADCVLDCLRRCKKKDGG